MSHDARELLPCPFCGGEAKQFTIGEEEPSNVGGDVIVCIKCSASGHVEFGRKENLVSRWNTRTTLSPDPVLLGEVREALEPFARMGELIELETTGFAHDDELSLILEDGHLMERFRVSDFERARALLDKLPKLTGEEV